MSTKLNQHLQDSFLRLSVEDTDFLKLVVGRVNPRFFTSRLTENIASLCFDYFSQFKEAPKGHFQDELFRLIEGKSDEEKDEYAKYVSKLGELHPPNQQYILNRIGDFVKTREREIALIEASELVGRGNIEDADNILFEALRSGIPEEDAGLDYLRDFSGLMERESKMPLMPTGIKALDRLIGGYNRGQLLVTLGGYKGGKTWSLMHLGRTALFCGLNVLHVSLEVSKDVMETRYDMMLSARGSRHVGEMMDVFQFNEDGDGDAEHRKIKIRGLEAKAVEKARKRVRRFGGSLRIKKYPMGQCKPQEMERYLNYLESFENFVPDVLIIDYLDIMDLGGFRSELRHQLNDAYIWAKGLADERNILVATVSQVRRDALQRRFVTPKDVAEDIRKVGNVDLMLAIGRDKDDVKMNVAGISVVANREGRQDCHCSFSMCYEIGQFCLKSWLGGDKDKEVKLMWQESKGETGDKVKDVYGD